MSAVLIAVLAFACAFVALYAQSIARRVVALGVVTVAVAGCYLELGAPLLAALQVLLYAGGLVVLFGLAIGTTGGVSEEKLGNRPATIVGGILALAILLAGLDVMPAVGQIPLGATPVDVDLARTITERPLAFEGIGLVVLVSVIGSLALLRGRREA